MNSEIKISKEYLAGFFDGEGSLTIRFRKDNRYKNGVQILPRINITQANKEILEKIKRTTKCGNIYFNRRDGTWSLDIYKIDELIKFTKMIKDKVIVKRKSLEKFYLILLMIKKKQHLDKKNLEKIKRLWLGPETEANTP